jgi:hypothetical protein
MVASPLSLIAAGVKTKGESDFAILPDLWGDKYPALFEVFARTTWDGEARKPGKIGIYCDDGKVTIRLTEENLGQVTFYTDLTVDTALEGLDMALAQGRCDWRKDKKWGRK